MENEVTWADVAHYYQNSEIKVSGLDDDGKPDISNLDFVSALVAQRFPQKPFLRPISSMKPHESRWFYGLIRGKKMIKYLNRTFLKTDTDILAKEWFKKYPKAQIIMLDYSNKPTVLADEFSPFVFVALIHNGFDVFSLIDRGLALKALAESEVANG